MRVGPLGLRRPPPFWLVDHLRAAVRRGQEVHAGGRRWSHSGWLAGDQHPEPVERLREKSERWTGSREHRPRRSETYGRKWPGSQRWTEHDSAVVQHLRICAAAGNNLRRRRAEQYYRTGDLQLRHVDPAELHVRRQQEPAVPARGVQHVQSAGLAGSKHCGHE